MQHTILQNYPVVAMFAAWFAAQFLKLVFRAVRERRIDGGFLFRLGGMPSSHSASAAACTMAVGLTAGCDSPVFAIALGMAFLIVVDAQGVRRAVGEQARILNRLSEKLRRDGVESFPPLEESLGHTRLEVAAGLALGVAVALILKWRFPEWAACTPQ